MLRTASIPVLILLFAFGVGWIVWHLLDETKIDGVFLAAAISCAIAGSLASWAGSLSKKKKKIELPERQFPRF
jgi:hypothetical protein